MTKAIKGTQATNTRTKTPKLIKKSGEKRFEQIMAEKDEKRVAKSRIDSRKSEGKVSKESGDTKTFDRKSVQKDHSHQAMQEELQNAELKPPKGHGKIKRASKEGPDALSEAISPGSLQSPIATKSGKAAEVRVIPMPDEAFSEMVDKIYQGVTKKGDISMTIELRSTVLQGAHIHVSSVQGKLQLRFTKLNAKTRGLLKGNESKLKSALKRKSFDDVSIAYE